MLTKSQLAICKGHQGSWLVGVTINGKTEKLPTAHKCFVRQGLDSLMYDRPVFWNDRPGKWKTYIKLLRERKRVVITDDAISYNEQKGRHSFTRKGYVAIYAIDDILANKDFGFHFRIVEKLAECVA
jgi:hypothetical protein